MGYIRHFGVDGVASEATHLLSFHSHDVYLSRPVTINAPT